MRIEGKEAIRLPGRSEIEARARDISRAWSRRPGKTAFPCSPILYALDNLLNGEPHSLTKEDLPRLITLTVLAAKVVRADGTVDVTSLEALNVAAARCSWNAMVCYDLQVPGSCRGGRRRQRILEGRKFSQPDGTITIKLLPKDGPPITLI